MSEISATDAGLVGFRTLREKPMVWPAWAIVSMAMSIISVIIMVMFAGPALADMQALSKSGAADPEALVAVYSRIGPAILVVLPISLVFYAVLYAGASRIILRPQDRGFGWLKLGADEVRQGLALLAVGAILLGAYIVLVMGAAILGAVSAIVSPILGALIGVLAAIAAIGGLIYIGVRLSLVSPATFATGRIDIRGAWALTKGRFGLLFGAYVLSVVMAIIISLGGVGAFFIVGMLIFGLESTSQAIFAPDMTSMATMFPPVGIAYYIWNAVVSGVATVVAMTPAPALYKQITGDDQTVFD